VTIDAGGAALQVAGIDDYRHGDGDLEPVLAALDRRPGVLRLLLSHYGEVAARVEPGDFAVVLAGDTHGGQICLPWVDGRVMLSDLKAPYRAGMYDEGGTPLHVSAGVGTSFLPFRLLCRPEVAVFRFTTR
jgi:predicted MPP superfamily phosphohydrolase